MQFIYIQQDVNTESKCDRESISETEKTTEEEEKKRNIHTNTPKQLQQSIHSNGYE